MSILLPLYVYPTPGAWDPLYNAAKTYPSVDFTVILNPCSGPCTGSLPDSYYLSEIPKLKAYDNIRTLGYVATNYTNKAISDVLREIGVYSQWPRVTNNSKLSVDGIFFDETPVTFAQEKYDYLKTARAAVKNSTNRFRDKFVAHNPGNIISQLQDSIQSNPPVDLYAPATSYLDLADLTVVYEESFSNFISNSTFTTLTRSKLQKSKSAVILHSIPDIPKRLLEWTVDQLDGIGAYFFLTNVAVKDEYYHSFSSVFQDLVSLVA